MESILSNDPEFVVPKTHLGIFLNDDVEVLHKDNSNRCRWFRGKVLRLANKCQNVLVQYYHVLNADETTKRVDWVPLGQVVDDELGHRHNDRLTIRPCCSEDGTDHVLSAHDPVEAWVENSWWEEGIASSYWTDENENKWVVSFPEDRNVLTEVKDLKVSKDWINGKWMDAKGTKDRYVSVDIWLKKNKAYVNNWLKRNIVRVFNRLPSQSQTAGGVEEGP